MPQRQQRIVVPARLTRPHPIVAAKRDALAKERPGEDGRIEPRRNPGIVHLRVAKRSIPRALRIVQAVLVEAAHRGYEVVPSERDRRGRATGVGVAIGGRWYPFEVWEETSPVPLTEAERARWEQKHRLAFSGRDSPDPKPPTTKPQADGRLRLQVDRHWDGSRCVWRDGVRSRLEEKLASFLTELERRSERDRRREERRRWDEAREAARVEHRERERQQAEAEAAKVALLREEIETLRFVKDVRDYVSAQRERLAHMPSVKARELAAWCSWASRWADTADPVQSERDAAIGWYGRGR